MIEVQEQVLKKAVTDSEDAILGTLGFKVCKADLLTYVAKSDKTQICIEHARTSVRVSVGPLSELHGLMHTDPPGFVELHWILEALVPEISESDSYSKPAQSGDEMSRELRRQLQMLVEHCRPLLEGDPSSWAKIREFMRDFGGLRKGEDETEECYIRRLREAADVAWNKRRFNRLGYIYDDLLRVHAKLTLRDYYRYFQILLRASGAG